MNALNPPAQYGLSYRKPHGESLRHPRSEWADSDEVPGGCTRDEKNDPNAAAPPFAGEAEEITDTPHKQKDSPVETERVGRNLLKKAGETQTRQVLQDTPAIQPRR